MEKIPRKPSGTLLIEDRSTFINVIFFVKVLRNEALGKQKVGNPKGHFGKPNHFYLLYESRKGRRERGFFPQQDWKVIVRRTTSFCNKNYSLPIERRSVGFQMFCHG